MFGDDPEERSWRHFSPLHDAEINELREQPRGLGLADLGELCDRPQVQLGRGLGEHGEHPPLSAGHDGLDRSDEVHPIEVTQLARKYEIGRAHV